VWFFLHNCSCEMLLTYQYYISILIALFCDVQLNLDVNQIQEINWDLISLNPNKFWILILDLKNKKMRAMWNYISPVCDTRCWIKSI